MKSLQSLTIAPLTAALLLGGLLIAGCNRNAAGDADSYSAATPAGNAATPADTTPGNGDPAMPADTTASGNATMGSAMDDTTAGNMSGADMASTDTTGSSAADISGASEAGSNMRAGASANAAAMVSSGPITETQFYQQAMMGGQKEIAMSQMESRQGSNAQVKAAADRIARDHTAMGEKIKAAGGASVAVMAGTDMASMDASLQGKTGAALDRAYLDMMVTDHQKTIAMFENAAKNASTPQARKLATDGLPKLRDHLRTVQQLQQSMGAS